VRAQGIERVGIELIEPLRSGGLIEDEMSILQNAQVLGDCRPADREFLRQFADGQRSVHESGEDGAASWIAERIELGVLVSIHLR